MKKTIIEEVEAKVGPLPAGSATLSVAAGGGPDKKAIEADPVVKALRGLGRVLSENMVVWSSGDRALQIECPWSEEHTGAAGGTFYVPVAGKFKCHHGHCEQRGRAEFLERLGELLAEDSGGLVDGVAALDFPVVAVDEAGGGGLGKTAVGRALGSYEATEDGLALAFEDEHRDGLRFDGKRKTWLRWTTAYWQQDDTERAFVWARDLLRLYRRGMMDLTPSQLRAWGKISVAAAIERAARAAMSVGEDFWDQDVMLAGCPGGEVDLRTGGVIAPDPAHGITKQLACAPDFGMPTPLWDEFLWQSTGGDLEMMDFLQAWAGYCLTGDTSEERFVFIYGPGGNGKGTFLFTMSAILKDYADRCDADMFMVRKYKPHTEEIARLAGVRAITASEIEDGKTFNVVKLKDFTGRDGKLTGAFKFKDTFGYIPQFKITFVGNNQPKLPEVDDAMRRRIILVPFTQKPASPDITLKDQLKDEYPGILAWMIEGENRRRTIGGLSALVPTSAIQATKTYLAEQDTLERWGEEICGFGPGDQMGVTEAFEAYRGWCYDQGETIQAGARTFAEKFCAKFPKCNTKKTKTTNVITGASLP